MLERITTRSRLLLLVPLLALSFTGCKRKQNDNIKDNSPDTLPLRLQLPKAGSAEDVRILQYGADDATILLQQSLLAKGPYQGGRQLRFFRPDNSLKQIRTFWPDDGSPEQLAYIANFDGAGNYDSESSYSNTGVRQTDGRRLADGTFEQNSFFLDGAGIYKHTIFGRQLITAPKPEWKPLSYEIFRDDKTIAVTDQRMDDGGELKQFYDVQHCLTETLHVDKSSTSPTEIDFHKDCKTMLSRIDFGVTKNAWNFDEAGKLADSRQWSSDGSWQMTLYRAGVPLYMQDWEVDSSKSDKTATPPRLVLYLSWIKEYNADESVSREIHFFTGTNTIQTIDVTEPPAKNAKLKPPPDLPALGSTTPAKNWTQPPPAPTATTPAPTATTPAPTATTPAPTATTPAPTATTPAPTATTPAPTATTPAPTATTPAPTAPGATSPTLQTSPTLFVWNPRTPSLGYRFFSGFLTAFSLSSAIATTTTQNAPQPFWSPSGNHVTFTYSTKGNLTQVDYFVKGKSEPVKTIKHSDGEHIRAKVNAQILKPLSPGPAPDKPKDPTPSAPPYNAGYDDIDDY